MAQTAPPPFAEQFALPLPRGTQFSRSRVSRQRLQPIDAAWIAGIIAIYGMAHLALRGSEPASPATLAIGMAIVALAYLLAARLAGLAAAVVAAVLLATCAAFITPQIGLAIGVFAALSVAALLAFASGSSLVALAIAGVAAWLQREGLLLGALLAILALMQHRRRARPAAILFFALDLLSVAFHFATSHATPAMAILSHHAALFPWLISPAALITAWFLLPFCGEIAEQSRRSQWLPILLWAAIVMAAAITFRLVRHEDSSIYLYAFLPLWFIVIGAGVARLLPFITGEIPIPTLRYVVAISAVALLIGVRARLAWPLTYPAAITSPILRPPPTTAPLPAPKVILPKPVPTPKPSPPPHTLVAHPPSLVKAPKAARPTALLHVRMAGRRIYRRKWILRWRRTYRHR